MVLTSHDQLGNTGRKTGSDLRSSRPRILSSGMLVSSWRWPPQRRAAPGRSKERFARESDPLRWRGSSRTPNWQPFSIVDRRLITG